MMAIFTISTEKSIQSAIIQSIQSEIGAVSVQIIGSEDDMKIVIDDSTELTTEQETAIQTAIASIYSARGYATPAITKQVTTDAKNIAVESIDTKE